jgi:hypothetical protein
VELLLLDFRASASMSEIHGAAASGFLSICKHLRNPWSICKHVRNSWSCRYMKEQKKETAAENINPSQILPKNFKELWH